METTDVQNNRVDDNISAQTPHLKKRQLPGDFKSTDILKNEPTHEEKVEKFFSHGADTRAKQEDGFLSFGYWTIEGQDYRQAAENLLELLLSNETPLNGGIILDVACGYGTETFKILDKLKPDKIIAIDITSAHIEYAKMIALERNVAEKISFEKQDACILPYKSASFTHVIGVEGPSQFNTREQFLKRAYDVLKPNGVLLLADVIIHANAARKSWLNGIIGHILTKQWYIPRPNMMNFERYRKMLVDIGYQVDFIRGIGANVYNGFARFNTKWSSIKNAIAVRGLWIGIGLTFISWLLGIAFKRGLLDYAYIRAVKK
jgi:ubiquinone/menaquinone biosynthesis C-methylase UbiE